MQEQIKNNKKEKQSLRKQFISFLKTYGVIGLAIGFVAGAMVKDYVNAIVKDFIDPLIVLLIPNLTELSQWKIHNFGIGHFITATINLLIIALIIFLFVKFILKKERVRKL